MPGSSLQTPSSIWHLAAATALLIAACTSPDRAPIPATTASIGSALPPLVTITPALSASAPQAPAERCDVRLPELIEALECNPKPRTLDYPDCRQFRIARLHGDTTCHPERLSLEVSGYQAIYDDLRVKVVWEAGPPVRAKLVLDRVESSIQAFAEKRGTELATIVFEARAPRDLRMGPGMRSITTATSAKITE